MKKIELKAELREISEKLNNIRNNKQVPWVLYWHKQEPVNLKIDNSDLLVILNKYGKTHVITIEFWKKKVQAMIQEIQKNPVNWKFLHVDFYAITAWEKIRADIPLNFVWESDAKKEWAMIEEILRVIEVKCLPEDLVDSFDVDISSLKKIDDVIRVSELNIDSSKYEILTKADDAVIRAVAVVDNVIEEEPIETKEETTEANQTEVKEEWK